MPHIVAASRGLVPAGVADQAGLGELKRTAGAGAIQLLTEVVQDCQREGSAPPGDPEPLVDAVWALSVGIVTLWLDGPLEGRCVTRGTTPEQLTAQIAALLETLLTRPGITFLRATLFYV